MCSSLRALSSRPVLSRSGGASAAWSFIRAKFPSASAITFATLPMRLPGMPLSLRASPTSSPLVFSASS
jgi:hypothetical protein